MVKIGSGVVSWSSKLQSIVALSTTEAEYIAAVSAGMEIRWMRNLLHEMGFCPTGPSVLRIDNQSAISDSLPMSQTRVGVESSKIANSVGNVWSSCGGQVHQCTNCSKVGNRFHELDLFWCLWRLGTTEMSVGLHRSGDRLAISHPKTFQDV